MPTRRALLGTAATMCASTAGCLVRGQTEAVNVLVAGSLTNLVNRRLQEAVDAPIRVEAHGSATAARMVADGVSDPDIVALADPFLLEEVINHPWHVAFATNALVLVYNPDTVGGRKVGEAGRRRWWEAIRDHDVKLGRTHPDHDPLGYRTLFCLELASEYYSDASGLRETILNRDQVYPETQLLAQFETGSVDTAFAYRNMAVERDYPAIDLPASIDLSAPELAEKYAAVEYELPEGEVVTGAPITYAATVLPNSPRPAVKAVFRTLTGGDILSESGFGLPNEYPRTEGNAPAWAAQ